MHQVTMTLGPLGTNCYILWGKNSDACVVIDPGDEPEEVLLQAKKLNKTIEAILLTHGHFDHVGGVEDIRKQTGCKVFLCAEDLSMPAQFTAGPLHNTDTYTEGDVLTLAGLTFRVLHTPGHTPGSVCLTVGSTMFSGDTLFRDSCGRTDLPGGSWAQLLQSLERLAGMDEEYTVYPGHGPATTLAYEKKHNPYMR